MASSRTSRGLRKTDLVRSIPLFGDLDESQLDQICRLAVVRRLRRGEILVRQGEASNRLFILASGRARAYLTNASGKEANLGILQPGDCIGEMSLIDGLSHSASVRAETACEALVLSQAGFMSLLPQRGTAQFAILRGLVGRLRHADQQIGSLALMDVYGRVAHALIELSEEDGHGNRIIRHKLKRQDLAKMVGTSREMVSRIMSDLAVQGLIAISDEPQAYITILQPDALKDRS